MSATLELHAHYEADGIAPEERLPGFGLGTDGHLFQIFDASLVNQPSPSSGGISGDPQLAAFLAPEGWRDTSKPIEPSSSGLSINVGTSELSRQRVRSWLKDDHILIIGGARSGRTALLQEFASQLFAATGQPVGYFSFNNSGPGLDTTSSVRITPKALIEFNANKERAELIPAGDLGLACLPDGRVVLLVDDCFAVDTLDNGSMVDTALSALHQYSKIQVIAVTTSQSINKCSLTTAMKSGGITVYLRPSAMTSEVDDGWRVRGITFRHRPGLTYRRGDAIVQTEDGQHIVHLAGSPK